MKPLQRCSRCKTVSYCSPECQKEHWEKHHKQHCKYLSGSTILPLTRHSATACPRCPELLPGHRSAQHPSLLCHLASLHDLWDKPTVVMTLDTNFKMEEKGFLPFPLGELSGRYGCKYDHTLSLMLQILHKISVSELPMAKKLKETIHLLYAKFYAMRKSMWGLRVTLHTKQNGLKLVLVHTLLGYQGLEAVNDISQQLIRQGYQTSQMTAIAAVDSDLDDLTAITAIWII